MRILIRSLGYLHPYWRLTAGGYLALLCTSGLTLLIPQLVRATVDLGIRTGDMAALRLAVLGILSVLAGRK